MFKLRKPLPLTLLAAAVLCAGCFKSENVVTKVKPDGDMRLDGVTYALPRTVVQVRIPFKRVETKPGLHERYAPCFFPKPIADGRVRGEGEVKVSMEQPTFSSSGEPDPDEHYIVKIKGGFFENKTMFLEFTPDGIITKGEASSDNKAIDFAIKAARTAVSVASSGLTPRGERAGGEKPLDKIVREAEVDICRSVVVAEAAATAASAAEAAAKAARKVAPPANPDDKTTAEKEAEAARALVKKAELEIAAAKRKVQNHLDEQSERLRSSRQTTPAPDSEEEDTDREDDDDARANPVPERTTVRPGRRGNRRGRGEVGPAPRALPAQAQPKSEDIVRDTRTEVGKTSSKLLNTVIGLAEQTRDKVNDAAAAAKPVTEPPAGVTATEDMKAAGEAVKGAGEAAKGINSAIEVVGSDKDDDTRRAAQAFANEFEAAQEVFKRIEQLRINRDNIASGGDMPNNLTAEAIKTLIEQADATITRHERTYFLGTSESDTWTSDFKYVPIKADPSGVNAVQTSQMLIMQAKGGLCPTVESNKQEIRIKPTFVAKNCPDPNFPDGLLKAGEGVFVRVSRVIDNDGFLRAMAVANSKEETRGKRGFYYRIPAATVVTLFKSKTLPADGFKPEAKNVLARENIKVAQLGITASLPASSAGRTTQYTVDFNEATGAMKNFKLASNAMLEATLAEEAGGAVTDIITAKKARDAAREAEAKAAADAAAAAAASAATAADPLNQKKKLLEELQTDNAIDAELKKKADSQTPPEP